MLGELPPLSGPLPDLAFYDAFSNNSLVLLFSFLCFMERKREKEGKKEKEI